MRDSLEIGLSELMTHIFYFMNKFPCLRIASQTTIKSGWLQRCLGFGSTFQGQT